MDENFPAARRALGGTYSADLDAAGDEYDSFLESLEEMKPRLGAIGIFFDIPDTGVPEKIEFRTALGLIDMTRLMVVDGGKVSYVVVFGEPQGEGAAMSQPDPWSLRLRWHSPWRQADDTEVERDFVTDKSHPFSVFEAVRSAVATKLSRNTGRVTLN